MPASPLIGQSVGIDISFVNTSATEAGYGPYVDLRLPLGADGNDGLTFTDATYLGAPVARVQLGADGSGCVTHPWAKNASGPLQICGMSPGQPFVALRLPFGSFTPGQPTATLHVTALLSPLADAGTPLGVTVSGGFQYGADPLDNPTTDPSITGSPASANLTPTVIRVQKTYNGPESETATGPNFPRSYTITATVAPGQTVTNLILADTLPNNIQYLSTDLPTVPVSSAGLTPSTSTPGGTLSRDFGTVVGSGGTDATLTFNYYVPRLDASNAAILPPATGAFNTSLDSVGATATWTPTDGRDAPGPVSAGPATHTLTDKSVAIQKSVRLSTDIGAAGVSPGDTLEWTMRIQVSDYFALRNLVVYDRLGDGTRWDGTAPSLAVAGNGFTSGAGVMAGPNYTVSAVEPSGVTPMAFRVSDELITRGPDGRMVGGCVDPVNGTAAPGCTPGYDDGPTTATVVFYSVVQQTYVDGTTEVVEGDTLGNLASVTADVLNTTTFAPTGNSIGDGTVAVGTAGTSASIPILRGTLEKSIYAVNGSTSFASPVHASPGDTVTYRLKQTFPTSRTDDYRMTDYLPLPVFYATGVTTFDPTVSVAPPPAGTAKYGPDDTFSALPGAPDPTVSSDATANSVQFHYGDFALYPTAPSTSDILFTVVVSNDPFADGLLLTNQARSQTRNAAGDLQTADSIVQITLDQPVLAISKGVVATSRAGATFTPGTTGPVTFSTPPGATCPAWTGGPVTSAGLAADPIDSNLDGVDAGDYVRFAVAVENSGHSDAFEVRIADTLPGGFVTPGSGLDLCVTDGAGSNIAFTNVGGGGGLFDQGIKLTDSASGSLAPGVSGGVGNATGTNIAVVTYTLQVAGSAVPNSTIVNTASLLGFTNAPGGDDHLASPLTDDATVDLPPPAASKSITADNQAHTTLPAVAIGEIVTYRVTLTVPEGTLPGATLTDTLPAGLALVNCVSVAPSSGDVTTTLAGGFSDACAPGVYPAGNPTVNGQVVTFDLGTITNANRDNGTAETLAVTYTAVVLNNAGNNRGTLLHNGAVLSWTGGSLGAVSAADVRVVEPLLTVDKSADHATGDAGDTIVYTITIANPNDANGTDAFGVSLSDAIPSGLTYVGASLSNTGGLVPSTLSESGGTVTATWNSFAQGATSTIRFSVTLDSSVASGQSYSNSANLSWTSLPGDVTSAQSPFSLVSTERTGSILDPGGATNDYRASDQADVAVPLATASKSITGTNQAHTTLPAVAVGEIVTYQVALTLPEGVQPSARLTDTLPAGLALVNCVSVAPSSGDVTTTLAGGFSDACAPGVYPAGNPTVNGQVVTFDLGTITNANRDNGTAETLAVTYRAVVLNNAGNNRGTLLHNSAVLSWTGGVATAASAPDVRVVEPLLTVSKSAAPTTGDAGDTIVYTITISNPNDANGTDAFDVAWTDTIPTGLTYVAASLQQLSGPAATTLSASAPTMTATWTTFGQGSTAVLRFSATLDDNVASGASFRNTASQTWTSLPGDVTSAQSTFSAVSTERTGNALNPGGASNDYAASNFVDVSVPQPAPAKTRVTTSEVGTSGARVEIGEIARFRVAVTFPEGVTPTISIRDTLPVGLRFINDGTAMVALVSNGAGLTSGTLAGAGLAVTGDASWAGHPTFVIPAGAISGGTGVGGAFLDGDDPTFALGTLTNADRDVDAEVVVVELNVLVDNLSTNQQNTNRDDQALIRTGSTTLATSAACTTATCRLTISEPSITFAKTLLTTPTDAGDVIVYRITITNASGATFSPAYEYHVLDTLPGSLVAPAGQPTITQVSGPAGPGWTDGSSGSSIDVTFTRIDPGTSYRIEIATTVGATQDAGLRIDNPATGAYSSLPGTTGTPTSDPNNTTGSANPGPSGSGTGERINDGGALNDYRNSSLISTSLASPSISKLGPTPAGATIGATTTFDVVVTVPDGTIRGLTVIDTLPAGFAPVGATVVTSSGGLLTNDFAGTLAAPAETQPVGSAGGAWTLVFGDTIVPADAVANNSFLVRFQVRVANVIGNQAPGTLSNSAGVRFTDPEDGATTIAAPQTPFVTILEPTLQVAKSADSTTPAFGQVVTYTLALSHASGSSSDAYDVTLGDTLPAGMTYVASSLANTAGVPPTAASESGGVISITFGSFPQGSTSTFTYQATVGGPGTVSLGQSLVNNARTTWTSLSGADANERTGADGVGAGLNNYVAAVTAPVIVNGIDLDISKTDGTTTATAGATLTYVIDYRNTGNQTATGVTLTETVPTGTTYTGSGWTCAGGSGAGNTCTRDMGSLGAGATGSVSFVVTVVDPIPSGMTQIANTASVADDGSKNADPTPANNTTTDTDSISQADLWLTKVVDDPRPDANQIVTFTIVVHNDGPANATNVRVADQLPAGLTFVSSNPTSPTYDSGTGVWNAGSISSGASTTLTITARATGSGSATNVAQVSHSDQGDPDSTPGNDVVSEDDYATAGTTPNVADLAVTKVVDVDHPDVGSHVIFTIVATNNGPDDAAGVLVTDTLPAGLTFVSATPSTGSWAAGTWTIGSLANGASATLLLEATVAGLGSTTNTATVSADPWDPTPGNNSASASIAQLVDLAVDKSVDDPTPNVGDTVTFTVTVANSGPGAAHNIVISDPLPAGLTFSDATPSQGSYDSGTGDWTVGTIALGGSASLALEATVSTAGVKTNTASVDAVDEPQSSLTNDSDSADVTPRQADLAVTKDVYQPRPDVGDTVTFTITLFNGGPDTATNVAITDALPAGLSFVSATPSQGAYNDSGGTWSVGTLANGASATLTIDATVTTGGDYTNTASVSASDQHDAVPGNNTDDAFVTTRQADIEVVKDVDQATPAVGATVEFTITATNRGPDPASQLVIHDALPAGRLTFVSATPSQGSYDSTSGDWTVGELAFPGSATLTLRARVVDSGSIPNTAAVTGLLQRDPNPDNDSDTATVVAPAAADLSLAKIVDNDQPDRGATVVFTLTVTNHGPNGTAGVVVRDALPVGVTYVSDDGGGAYDSTTGDWTVGGLAEGASTSLAITVTVDVEGPVTNTAEVTASGLPDPDSTVNNHDPGEDDQASATLNARGVADLSLVKTVDRTAVTVGSQVTYTLVVTNAGPNAATGVIARDQLPAGVTWISDSGGYDHGTGAWTIGSLGVGSSASLTITVRVGQAGTIVNTAEVVAETQRDPDSTPNDGVAGQDDQGQASIGSRNRTPPPTATVGPAPEPTGAPAPWLFVLLTLVAGGLACSWLRLRQAVDRPRRRL